MELEDVRSQSQTQTRQDDPEEEEDSDEEDQPLALMNGLKPQTQPGHPVGSGRHGGKKAMGHMTVAGTAPALQTTTVFKKNADATGVSGKSKTKPDLGEEQLQRLASGVTVDTEGETIQVVLYSCCTNSSSELLCHFKATQ